MKKDCVEALHDISIKARPREILAIMGPSGCGKSTLLKIIAGIDRACGGSLHLFGTDCTKSMKQETKRRIGFIYQDHNLLPWRSVEGNLRLPLEMFGIHKEQEYERPHLRGAGNCRALRLPQGIAAGALVEG